MKLSEIANKWAIEISKKDIFDKIFIGVDSRNPPGEDDCPFCVIRPVGFPTGQEVSLHKYILSVDFGIINDVCEQNNNIYEYKGISQADEIGINIWNTLQGAIPEIALSICDYEIESINFFPLIMGSLIITINQPNVIGL